MGQESCTNFDKRFATIALLSNRISRAVVGRLIGIIELDQELGHWRFDRLNTLIKLRAISTDPAMDAIIHLAFDGSRKRL
jgi:hypothetical protein